MVLCQRPTGAVVHTDLHHLSRRGDFSVTNTGLMAHILRKLLMALDEGFFMVSLAIILQFMH